MKLFLRCVFIFLFTHAVHAATYRLHTVQSGDVWSVIRFTNLTDKDDVIYITGFDNERERFGPVALEIDARATVVLSSRELERGAPQKGLYDGLGDGSGGWQLELETDLEISAISFKSGLSSDVLAVAEILSANTGGLPPRFLWAHRIKDRMSGPQMSPGPLRDLNIRNGVYEMLSAYDWEPYDTVGGVELGWGEHELYYHRDFSRRYGRVSELQVLRRFSGHLDYSAFAVLYGRINDQPLLHAYMLGTNLGSCNRGDGSDEYEELPSLSAAENHRASITAGYLAALPPEGTRWEGAAVVVTPQGEFGQGQVSFTLGETYSMAYHEGLPHSNYDENEFNPLIITFMAMDAEAFHVETGDQLLVLDLAETLFKVHDPYRAIPRFSEFRFHGSHCAELTGWVGSDGSASWAFGARLVEADDTDEE